MFITDLSIRRPVVSAVFSIILVVFGLFVFWKLPVRELPSGLQPPIVQVQVDYKGASAEIVSSEIVEIIEDVIGGAEGIKNIDSSSENGRATIKIEFDTSIDLDAATNDIRDRVSRVADNLPEDANAPEILKQSAGFTTSMWLSISSTTWSDLEIGDYTRRYLVDNFSNVKGVGRILVGGLRELSVRIYISPTKLAANDLTVQEVEQALKKENIRSIVIYNKGKKYFAPQYVQELKKILKKNIGATFLSGGTDLSLTVTKERKDISSIIYMNSISELNYIKNNNKYIEVGASTPLIEFESYIKKYYPDFTKILKRYGSPQIRNVATVAGNIATASPIGDCLPLLLSLNAQVVLQDLKKNKILFLDNFFISYRKTKLKKGQFISSIRIPIFKGNILKSYKVSKRFDDDISSVCAAFNLEIVKNKFQSVRIAYGGMAAIPKRAVNCEKILSNSLVTDEIIHKAKEALERDFKPISDMRASGSYRMNIAKNLLEKCCAEIKQKKLIGIYF